MNKNKNTKEINAPKGAKYVREFMETLPIGIVNKKRTGCGATAMMLENTENIIVCCPTQELIRNKVEQYPNERCPFTLFGVMDKVSYNNIVEHIFEKRSMQPIKILVTYDSLQKVLNAIKTVGESFDNYHFVVDEYQELLHSCIYREVAILRFLRDIKDINNITYLSATPIPFAFQPRELVQLESYVIKWAEEDLIQPRIKKCNSPYALIKRLMKNILKGLRLKLNGNIAEEYFFFVNSVETTSRLIKDLGLTNEQVKVVCANNKDMPSQKWRRWRDSWTNSLIKTDPAVNPFMKNIMPRGRN